MGHHHSRSPAPIVQSIQETPGYITKTLDFLRKPETQTYLGRAVIVIAAIALTYYLYKNRKSLFQSCAKVSDKFRSIFNKKEKDPINTSALTPRSSFKANLMSLDPNKPINVNVNLRNIPFETTEGKESSDDVLKVNSTPGSV